MDKSSRRRSRERIATIVSRALGLLALGGAMMLVLWLVDNTVNR